LEDIEDKLGLDEASGSPGCRGIILTWSCRRGDSAKMQSLGVNDENFSMLFARYCFPRANIERANESGEGSFTADIVWRDGVVISDVWLSIASAFGLFVSI